MKPDETHQLGILDSNQYITDSESAALPIWLIPNNYFKVVNLLSKRLGDFKSPHRGSNPEFRLERATS